MSEQILDRPAPAGTGNGVLPGFDSGQEGSSSRNRTFLVVALAIVAGLVLGGVMLFVMQTDDEAVAEDSAQASAQAAAVAEAQAQEAEVAAEAAGEVVTTTKVKITSRDPFALLVPKPAPAPVPKAVAPVQPSDPSAISSPTGATISALSISKKGNSATLKLDGKKYSVDEGEAFAKSYRLYDIFNDNCAGFLYGDQNVVVCEGDSVTVG
jgi:type II secretory pathway pseudopilin PulG